MAPDGIDDEKRRSVHSEEEEAGEGHLLPVRYIHSRSSIRHGLLTLNGRCRSKGVQQRARINRTESTPPGAGPFSCRRPRIVNLPGAVLLSKIPVDSFRRLPLAPSVRLSLSRRARARPLCAHLTLVARVYFIALLDDSIKLRPEQALMYRPKHKEPLPTLWPDVTQEEKKRPSLYIDSLTLSRVSALV